MKKIIFNDKFELTQSVLDGRKTMTRRIIKLDKLGEYSFDNALKHDWGKASIQAFIKNDARYKVGEVVAIAQAYRDIAHPNDGFLDERYEVKDEFAAGWTNKMFVAANLMPHHIRIKDVKMERLQDISDEDCISEGIRKWTKDEELFKYDLADGFEIFEWRDKPRNPREAFAFLIDRISGKGTWENNPWVFAYKFELVD